MTTSAGCSTDETTANVSGIAFTEPHASDEHELPFDPRVFEKYCVEKETIDGLDFAAKQTRQELLKKISNVHKEHNLLLERKWRYIAKYADDESRNKSIRIMQWNILAQALATGKDNFVKCPEEALKWKNRRLQILQEILTIEPDVVCLQEVDHFHLFKDALQAVGYEGTFLPKPDSPALYTDNSNGPDGCAIFYHTDKLQLLKINKMVLKANKMLTNQVSIFCHLECRMTGKQVVIATTHLKAKEGWDALRHKQGESLLDNLNSKSDNKPLIICGDFNAEHSEPVYKAFYDSSLNIRSAYTLLSNSHDEPPYTTWKIRGRRDGEETAACRTIDYIWYTVDNLDVKSVLEFPTKKEIGEFALPSFRYPSDHLSLAVDVSWKDVN